MKSKDDAEPLICKPIVTIVLLILWLLLTPMINTIR